MGPRHLSVTPLWAASAWAAGAEGVLRVAVSSAQELIFAALLRAIPAPRGRLPGQRALRGSPIQEAKLALSNPFTFLGF